MAIYTAIFPNHQMKLWSYLELAGIAMPINHMKIGANIQLSPTMIFVPMQASCLTHKHMTDIKAQANHKAWEIWQDARKTAASHENIKEWQRLNRATTALDNANPTLNKVHAARVH
jgi:hypothetical protein